MLNIKHFLIVKPVEEATILLSYGEDKNFGKLYREEALGILKQKTLNPDERYKQKTNSGLWNITVDENKIYYLLLTDPEYSERIAFKFIEETQEQVKAIEGYYLKGKNGLEKQLKKFITTQTKKYEDPGNVDKVAKVEKVVKEVELIAADNIRKVQKNLDTLDETSKKSESLAIKGQIFQERSKEVKKIYWWQNMKLNIIIGLIALSLIGLLIYILFIK